jgi:diacylglycerol kinase
MTPFVDPQRGSWSRKFRCAARGLGGAVRSQCSFFVHLLTAGAVVGAGIALNANLLEWCLLVLCIVAVLVAELFNTAIEHLARAVTSETNEHIRDALDTGSGAVLLAAIGAAVAGSLVLGHRLGCTLDWWSC